MKKLIAILILALASVGFGGSYYVDGSEYISAGATAGTGVCGAIPDTTHITLAATADDTSDTDYVGKGIAIIAGTGSNVTNNRKITAYDHTTKVATVNAAWHATTPVDGESTYLITKGDDVSGNGAIATPWMTVKKALDTVSTAEQHTVYVAAADYREAAYNYLLINNGSSGKDIIIQGETGTRIVPVNATFGIYFYNTLTGAKLHFKNITIAPTAATNAVIFDDTTDNLIIFEDCTVIAPDNVNNFAVRADMDGADNLKLWLKHNTIITYGTGFASGGYIGAGAGGYIKLTDNTINSSPSTAKIIVSLGANGDTAANPIGPVYCAGNKLAYVGGTPSHCMLIGSGANSGYYFGNTASGGDIQYVIKGDDNVFENNIGYRLSGNGYGATIKGGNRNRVKNNTMYVPYFSAFEIQDGEDTSAPSIGNVVTDNIFYGNGANVLAMSYSGAYSQNTVNNNCYYSTGTNYVNLNSTNYATLATLQAAWYGIDHMLSDNDSNSIFADPKFVNPAAGDYRTQNPAVKTMGASGGVGFGGWIRSR